MKNASRFAAICCISVAFSLGPAGADTGWLVQVQQDIETSEYEISWQTRTHLPDLDQSWHAVNRAQGLRIYFTPGAVRIIPRRGELPEWEWGLSLIGYGRGGRIEAVEVATLLTEGNRIDYHRRAIREYFVNDGKGIVHGFELMAPPTAERNDSLRLDLMLLGNLSPALSEDRNSIDFSKGSGLCEIHYGDIEAFDARGEQLPVSIGVTATSDAQFVRLLVDDRESVYPLTIRSLSTSASWTAEIDQEAARFGYAVDSAGDVNGDGYDDVLVGAYWYDGGLENEGGAWVFGGSAAGLSAEPIWAVEADERVAFMGIALAGAGDVNGDGYDDVIIGVPLIDDGDGAWVYHGSPTGLSLVPDWEGQGFPSTGYGFKVDTAGDVNGDGYDDVIIGANLYSSGAYQGGAAFVYHGSAAGLAIEEAWMVDSDQNNASLGLDVGGAGDVNGDGYDDVVVGAADYDVDKPGGDNGRAWVYHGSPAGLSSVAAWESSGQVSDGARYGISVATAGDVNGDGYADVLVGASEFSSGQPEEGRAYLYYGSPTGLLTAAAWTEESDAGYAKFGGSVKTAGDVNDDGYADVYVGAPYLSNSEHWEGGGYVFYGSSAGLPHTPDWQVESNQEPAQYGRGGTAGDVNGDGAADVIVGACDYSNGQDGEGMVWVYHGSPSPVAAGAVPDGDSVPGVQLGVNKTADDDLVLNWGVSCLGSDADYGIYEGQIGDFASHTDRRCGTLGATTATLTPREGDRYYLVVPLSTNREGSYGVDSDSYERPQGISACHMQVLGGCPE